MSQKSIVYKRVYAFILTIFLIAYVLCRNVYAADDIAGTAHFEMDKMRLTIYAHCTETLIGDICADAIRDLADTELSLMHSGLIVRIFHNGEVSMEDLRNVFSENEEIFVGKVTPRQLREYLENAVSRVTLNNQLEIDPEASDSEFFAQISGFCFEYDVSAPPYERVTKIMIGSSALDMEDQKTLYSIAVPYSSLSDNSGFTPEGFTSVHQSLSDALVQFVRTDRNTEIRMDRIRVIGAPEKLIQKYPVLPIAAGIVIILVLIYFWRKPIHRL